MNAGQGLGFPFDSASDGVSPASFRPLDRHDGDGSGGDGGDGIVGGGGENHHHHHHHAGLADDALLDNFVLDDAGGVGEGGVATPLGAPPPLPVSSRRGPSPPLRLPPGLGGGDVLGGVHLHPPSSPPPDGCAEGGSGVVRRGGRAVGGGPFRRPEPGRPGALRGSGGGGGREVKAEVGLPLLPAASALHHPPPGSSGFHGAPLGGMHPLAGHHHPPHVPHGHHPRSHRLPGPGLAPLLGVHGPLVAGGDAPLSDGLPTHGGNGGTTGGVASSAGPRRPSSSGMHASAVAGDGCTGDSRGGGGGSGGIGGRGGAGGPTEGISPPPPPGLLHPSPGTTTFRGDRGGRTAVAVAMDVSPASDGGTGPAADEDGLDGRDYVGREDEKKVISGGTKPPTRRRAIAATITAATAAAAVAATAATAAGGAGSSPAEGGTGPLTTGGGGGGGGGDGDGGGTLSSVAAGGGGAGGSGGTGGADMRRLRAKRNREAAARSRTKSKAALEEVVAAHRHASDVNEGLRDLLTHLLHPERDGADASGGGGGGEGAATAASRRDGEDCE